MEKYSQFRDRGKYITHDVVTWQGSHLMHVIRVWHSAVLSRHIPTCRPLPSDLYLSIRPEITLLLHRCNVVFSLPTMDTSWVVGKESYAVDDPWHPRHMVDRLAD